MDKFISFREYLFYKPYPPYHVGYYLEPFFYNYIKLNNISLERLFIPVYWTICYINNRTLELQETLNTLDKNQLYFAVSQHDDAIKEILPINTIKFCAGGNNGGVPIPLVCSKIPKIHIKEYGSLNKDLLCSFCGSLTHNLRLELCNEFNNKKNTIISLSKWTTNIDKNKYKRYINNASRSKFLLCPRGYGLQSFRLYESFQLGCVPVIITDKRFLPWEDELDWESFAIITDNCKNLYDLLDNISDTKYMAMLTIGQKLYEEYFTLKGTCKQIIKRLKQL